MFLVIILYWNIYNIIYNAWVVLKILVVVDFIIGVSVFVFGSFWYLCNHKYIILKGIRCSLKYRSNPHHKIRDLLHRPTDEIHEICNIFIDWLTNLQAKFVIFFSVILTKFLNFSKWLMTILIFLKYRLKKFMVFFFQWPF